MSKTHPQRLQSMLLQLLPADHSAVGNLKLWEQFQAAAQSAGAKAITEDAFKAARAGAEELFDDALTETGPT